MIWVQFIICAGLIIWTATLLSKYGDVLADKTGLGRAWVGAILIAGVTSLPELASGVSAVAWLNAPNLAAGAVVGSCLFNLVLIAMMDLTYQPGRILAKAHDGHVLSGGLGVLLLGMVAIGVLVGTQFSGIGVPGFSLLSLLILVIYAMGGRMISTIEQARQAEVLDKEAEAGGYAHIGLRKAWLVFGSSAPQPWWRLESGLHTSATKSQPAPVYRALLSEACFWQRPHRFRRLPPAWPLSALARSTWPSPMCSAQIYSTSPSCRFMTSPTGEPTFWASLNNANGFTAVMAMMMTGVVIVSLMYRVSPKTPYRFSWDGIALLVMYIGSITMLYLLG